MRQEFPLYLFLVAFAVYTVLLFVISLLTSRKTGTGAFFSGDHKAPWPVVAYGMIGSSISGVTFISVPGNVWTQNFYYMPMVFGFVVGYIIIAKVLLPLFYRQNLTSIYEYLEDRFGKSSHRTGAVVFMVSRILGAAVRIFVVIVVLFEFLPDSFTRCGSSIPAFSLVTALFLVLLYLYTFKGGVKTIVWTDVLQTTLMLLAVALTIINICRYFGWGFSEMVQNVSASEWSTWFDWNPSSGTNTVKQFVSGIFVSIAMTGLDQAMMQKSLACKNLRAAQKNIYSNAIILVAVNVFFVLLGSLLCTFVSHNGGFEALGISKTDEIFASIASGCFGIPLGLFFLVGLISASYPSAGAALTSITTSFCVDFLGFGKEAASDFPVRTRKLVQAAIAVSFLLIITLLFVISNDAVINLVYKLASYTYGPLLGIFFFGILTKWSVKDRAVPVIAAISPILCILINWEMRRTLSFDLGFSLLIVNGLLTFAGMYLFRKRK